MVAEAIATTLAAEVVKGLTKLIAKMAFEKISIMCWGFDDHFENLKNKFETIEALLMAISSCNIQDHGKNTLANKWLQKVKKLAYLADEVMDDYALEIIRKTKLDSLSRVKVKIYNLKDRPWGFRINTFGRVSHILSEFDKLGQEAKDIGLNIVKEVASSYDFDNSDYNGSLYQARKHAATSASKLVGRKHEEQNLLQMICKPTAKGRDLSAIAIFGIGGLGKTTLARRLYKHKIIDRHFDKKKVWIDVSNNFNVDRILKEMIESLTQKKCGLSNTEAIIRKLRPELQGKKFLLVLDDVWNNNQPLWDSLRVVLQSVNYVAGSTILVTTRSKEVAEKARAVCEELKGLSEDESWELCRQELPSETFSVNAHSFEYVGRKIVEKCKGVPLAIKVIARLLQSRKQLTDWKAIERNEVWNLPQESTENQILPSLQLSLRYLRDPALTLCFAYCAIFPKGTSMKKDQLIALWLSQGFLQEHEASTSSSKLEVIGEKYIQILLNNLLLQEETDHDTVISYKMHDLVHDLANYIMKDDLCVWKEESRLKSEVNYRHLIFNFSINNDMKLETNQEIMLQKLRTASFRMCVPRWDLLFLAKYMRTLIMVNIGLTEVSQDIDNLKHLRYLDLSENLIQTLPESICELYLLQTLRILHCAMLTKLPKNLHKLVNLRHLLTSKCLHVSKRSLQQLTTLQTLPRLELRDGKGWTIDELGCLPTVKGEICISRLEHVHSTEQAKKANLVSKDEISKLDLRWGESRAKNSNDAKYNDKGVLDGLEPHPNIKSISIQDYSDVSFPSWLMKMTVKQGTNPTQLTHLTMLELQRCRRLQHLPTLGELPALSYLKLEEFNEVKCIDDWFYQTGKLAIRVFFPALRHLRTNKFPKLTNWKSPSSSLSAFTCLESLEVSECHYLELLPTLNYQSLRDLELEKIGSSQPLDIIKHNHELNSLHLTNIPKMTALPKRLLNCTNLQILEIHECENLESFPTGKCALFSLKKLRISNCIALTSLPDDLFHGGLIELSIGSCYRLSNLPRSLENCASLQHMRVKNCPSIGDPVPNLCMLEGLLRLTMLNAGCMMASVLQSIPHLHNLHDLEIGGFEDDEECRKYFLEMAAPLSSQSLIRLVLRDNEDFPRVTFLPQQLQCLTSIECLYIDSFALQELPDWIGKFSSLEELRLSFCKKLTSLASKKVMLSLSHLKRLYIDDCPYLEMRCAKEVCAERVHIMFDGDDI